VKTLATLNAADQTPLTSLLYSGSGTTYSTQGQGAFWVITNTNSFISISAEL
jgi:negative regulator of replication initiation